MNPLPPRAANAFWTKREAYLRRWAAGLTLAPVLLSLGLFFFARDRSAAIGVVVLVTLIASFCGFWYLVSLVVVRHWFVREEVLRDTNEQLHAIRQLLERNSRRKSKGNDSDYDTKEIKASHWV
jgi:hypothetical protein